DGRSKGSCDEVDWRPGRFATAARSLGGYARHTRKSTYSLSSSRSRSQRNMAARDTGAPITNQSWLSQSPGGSFIFKGTQWPRNNATKIRPPDQRLPAQGLQLSRSLG